MIRLAVIGAKGGVGKSTLVYDIARVLSKNYPVTIVDASTSRTISNINEIRGSLQLEHDYLVERGNLKILSLNQYLTPYVNIGKFQDIYNDIISDEEFILVDYGVHIYERAISDELFLFYTFTKKINGVVPTNFIAVSNSQNFVINSTRKLIEAYISLLMDLDESCVGKLTHFVINMVRDESNLKVDVKPLFGIVEIPFYRELSFNGFWNTEVPKEIENIAKDIESMRR
ncbi:hypothetical protein GWK48_01505 [Metallosphaera tengchongensis]|uniref:CobQ/CobB/MinD/ParA nucleotide binding domain-containing protein n=1 Tax=Metallosphaera tengchongensis TaxID=1532350 RepID=A0A6N0NT14_9CREN|nr:hypothetical protein [Metallosphaera tengchongensis]QKQ99246.1 hypothetical protein GWK48_01505 [Metallosphaera tengchongensis]